jgi:mevalonate kinase
MPTLDAAPVSLSRVLAPAGTQARAAGKAILLGEHAVVYGHPALALALPDVQLRLVLGAPLECGGSDVRADWENGLALVMDGVATPLPTEQKRLILEGLDRALRASGEAQGLFSHRPQRLVIDSAIPLGAGMGGSAAMSTAFVRLALAIRNQTWDRSAVSRAANDVDALFHGKASGLDAAAVSSDGVIWFRRGETPTLVRPGVPFHLVLLDSGERASTADMVAKVAHRLEACSAESGDALARLGHLAEDGRRSLVGGNLLALGKCLDNAHEALASLGVSTARMDTLCEHLRSRGALGAKLTGAGGGGLVLGLFVGIPNGLVQELRNFGRVFITSIGR